MVDQGPKDRLIIRVKQLYDEQSTSRSWQEVLDVLERDRELFKRCLKRASAYQDASSSDRRGGYSLLIACNIMESLEKVPSCYFCARSLTRADFMKGEIHLEHFQPRSHSGTHEPANITLACRQCNLLKSDLTKQDMLAVLESPDEFFDQRRWGTRRTSQLKDFAEIYYPRIAGLPCYANRHGIDRRHARNHWDALRANYRTKWQ